MHRVILLCAFLAGLTAAEVRVIAVPGGGIEPRVAVAPDGAVNLLCFRGKPAGGDLHWLRRPAGSTDFSPALQVNTLAGSATAMGTVRGGQIALGRGGRPMIAWNGSAVAQRGNGGEAPLLFARLADGGKAFERERNLLPKGWTLDGGGAVATTGTGEVAVAIHLGRAGESDDKRTVQIWRSTDDGGSFGQPAVLPPAPVGACACCQLACAFAADGRFGLAYRSAAGGMGRGTWWLEAAPGAPATAQELQSWMVAMCPMSTFALLPEGSGWLGAWETEGQVWLARLGAGPVKPVAPAGGAANRKHPAIAVGKDAILLVWDEGTGWEKGGDLAWQVYSRDLAPLGTPGRLAGGIPKWSFPGAWAESDGSFTVVH